MYACYVYIVFLFKFLYLLLMFEKLVHTMIKKDKGGGYLKKLLIFLLGLALLGGSIGYVTASMNRPIPQAQSFVLMEASTGRVLYEKNSHEPLKIASITKIMTAILAIESNRLNEYVTVSQNAVNQEGSKIYLVVGEKILLKDLVYGLMLRSGNDAAMAIAEFVGGSKEGFVYLMNQKATEIGMKDTAFSNPSGLDETDLKHVSSAYDMALLTKYALKNESYQKIAGTKTYQCPHPTESWNRQFVNKHRLVRGDYAYATTGKTGFTKAAGRTLVTTAKKGDLSLIVVTIRDGSDWKDHVDLFEWGFAHYKMTKVAREGIQTYLKDKYYLNQEIILPLTSKEKGQLEKKVVLLKQSIHTPFTQIDGSYEIWINKEKIYEVPLRKVGKGVKAVSRMEYSNG